jgi:hypothetical protein
MRSYLGWLRKQVPGPSSFRCTDQCGRHVTGVIKSRASKVDTFCCGFPKVREPSMNYGTTASSGHSRPKERQKKAALWTALWNYLPPRKPEISAATLIKDGQITGLVNVMHASSQVQTLSGPTVSDLCATEWPREIANRHASRGTISEHSARTCRITGNKTIH